VGKTSSSSNLTRVVLTSDRNVYAFGRNNQGQLGLPPSSCESSLKSVLVKALTGYNIVKVRMDTRTGLTMQIASGATHVMALGDNGVVWSWGSGFHGQTGRFVRSLLSLTVEEEISRLPPPRYPLWV
jgi:alpha-tubulin suppressor-like RCC1 family protein